MDYGSGLMNCVSMSDGLHIGSIKSHSLELQASDINHASWVWVDLTFLDPEMTPLVVSPSSWAFLGARCLLPGVLDEGQVIWGSCLATTQDEQQERWGSSFPNSQGGWGHRHLILGISLEPVGVWETRHPHLVCHGRCPVELHNFFKTGLPWSLLLWKGFVEIFWSL